MIKLVEDIDGWLRKLTKGKCEYADLRVQQIEIERLASSSRKIEPVEKSVTLGFGVRVLKDGSWGFAASSQFDEKEYERIVKLAIAIADASRKVNKNPIDLGQYPTAKGVYETPFTKDPFVMPIAEKLDLLAHWEDLMHADAAISATSAFLDFRRETKMFRSTAGSDIKQVLLHTGAGVTCGIVKGRRERYERSFPTASGQFVSGGYEQIATFKIEENIGKVATQAIEMQTAAECPDKVTDIVLSPDLASLQIHESIGHPLELDRVFGSERNFSGTSFATTDQLNKLKYGSEIVNVYSDPTLPGGLATYKYDDDGVEATRMPLIKDGLLVGYLSSLETAKRINAKSSAAARAEGWGNVPLVRMTNLTLEPGDKKFADMIAEIEDGIYIEGVEQWSIDDNRDNFTLGGEVGWEIKGGKLGAMVKSPSYSGNTVQFWNSCDSTGHKDEWVLWGTPNCGKGEPGQNGRTAQGAAYVRFRQVKVGG
ncbi:MAG: TldD/PmbA family protein [bacterium]|nr:TldD/PmbA family protein [bacterium]